MSESRGAAFEITADETVLVDPEFEGGGAGVFGSADTELFREGKYAQDATNARLALVAMDLFTEDSDVRSRTRSSRQELNCG